MVVAEEAVLVALVGVGLVEGCLGVDLVVIAVAERLGELVVGRWLH